MAERTEMVCVCAEGHRWPAAAADARPGGDSCRCPRCGRAAEKYVTPFTCAGCKLPLECDAPLRGGKVVVACPRCGQRSGVMKDGVLPASAQTGPFVMDLEATPPPVPFTPPLSGPPQVAGYTILGEIGRGAMGVVYKARHEKLKRVVALKLVLAGPGPDSPELLRFHAEAEAVARLHHPHIVQIYEVGEQDGRPFLALEFVNGGTLKKHLDGRPQPPRAAAQLLEQLAGAIHAAHARGIVHRDLKPANILLTPPPAETAPDESARRQHLEATQRYGLPKIADFGLAKRLDQDGVTRRGEILGTPLYMAPEQAWGRNEQVGPATDVYALGAMLYEMLTGQPLFQATDLMDLLRQVKSAQPEPPPQPWRRLSADLRAICLKCLEKEPHQRYASALALAQDLRRFLDGEAVRARPVGAARRVWRWCLRNPIPTNLLTTAVVLLAVGFWWFSVLSRRIVEQTAMKGARQQLEVIHEVWLMYNQVADGLKGVPGVHPTVWYPPELHPKDPKAAGQIPVPARFVTWLGDVIEKGEWKGIAARNKRGQILRLQTYSIKPMRPRPHLSPPDKGTFEWDALQELSTEEGQARGEYARIEFSRKYNQEVLRYAIPLVLKDTCLVCHNNVNGKFPELQHPEGRKWEEGETRGVLEVVRALDQDYEETREQFQAMYLPLLGTAAVSLLLCGLVLRLGRRV